MDGKFRAVSEAKELEHTTKHAQALATSLRCTLFPLAPYRMDAFSAPSHSPDIINKISRLPFGGKYAMNCQLIEVEMQRLSVLIGQAADRHK